MVGYWCRSFFTFLWTSVHKNAEREPGQYPATLTSRFCTYQTSPLSPDANYESRSPSVSFSNQCCVIRSWNFQYELYLIGWANHEISFIWVSMTTFFTVLQNRIGKPIEFYELQCVLRDTTQSIIAFYGNIYDTRKKLLCNNLRSTF